MKYIPSLFFIILIIAICTQPVYSQCALCAKTALQMGEKPAAGLNSAILYLMMAPFAIVGFIAYRWWKHNK
jgi:hypothetical protein